MRALPALLALVLVAGCSLSSPQTKGPQALPDVTLPALHPGEPGVDLGALKGPAVLNLWASWCKPCRTEMPIYQRFHQQHAGVKVIGVNTQETRQAAALRFALAAKVTYPLVSDPDQHIRAIALPRLLLVDKRGRVAWSSYVVIRSLGQLESLVRKHLGVTS